MINTVNNKFQKSTPNFFHFQPRLQNQNLLQNVEFDGKRLRKAIARKTVDYNTSIVRALETRLFIKDFRDRRAFQPDSGYYTKLLPPISILDNPLNCVTTKFVRTSTNKFRCPIFCVLWTPEGRRLVTGASSGEFTLWNGLTFNFETILQAHDSAVRVMIWSRNDSWMVTGDHSGYVKYWQSNMNNVKMFQAHKEAVRAISFCPTDSKLATCSDDGTVRIWDFLRCNEERILRGHGADVKCLHWHPIKSLLVSGSKDNQQPIKLWDPRTGNSLATIHAHKNTVMDLKWNQNGNWLLTASRDHLIKIFDIRNLGQEMQTFRGHKKEACCLIWHPIHENLFTSGGSDGSILFWQVGTEKEIGSMEQAHDSVVWSLDWHPLGHILASGSNDHTCKFWTRNRPGDKMRDKYNLNLMPKGQEDAEYEDVVTAEYDDYDEIGAVIPGLGLTEELTNELESQKVSDQKPLQQQQQRKVPFSKRVPKQFENQWSDNKSSTLNSSQTNKKIKSNNSINNNNINNINNNNNINNINNNNNINTNNKISKFDHEDQNDLNETGSQLSNIQNEFINQQSSLNFLSLQNNISSKMQNQIQNQSVPQLLSMNSSENIMHPPIRQPPPPLSNSIPPNQLQLIFQHQLLMQQQHQAQQQSNLENQITNSNIGLKLSNDNFLMNNIQSSSFNNIQQTNLTDFHVQLQQQIQLQQMLSQNTQENFVQNHNSDQDRFRNNNRNNHNRNNRRFNRQSKFSDNVSKNKKIRRN